MKYANIIFTYIVFDTSVSSCTQESRSSYKIPYFDWLGLCPALILRELDDWYFSRPYLCEVLPCRKERKDFVGHTNLVLFSIVNPVPLINDVRLAAVADDVLANILDLDHNNVWKSPGFAEFVSGNYVLPSSNPIAHRYGGHQARQLHCNYMIKCYNPGQNYWLHSNYLLDMCIPNKKIQNRALNLPPCPQNNVESVKNENNIDR